MSPEAVNRALPVLGIVAIFGAALPSIEKAWEADNQADASTIRKGEMIYVGGALTLGLLASYGQGNLTPLILTAGFVAAMLVFYEHALRTPTPEKRQINL